MARKFYTPISLTGLELTNFKIQNLPDNPSPYGAGHSYYNTVAKELRIYDGTNWVPVGGSIEYGTYASLPAAGNNGRVYATTDTQTLYLDYNNAWLQIGASGSATYVNSISGTTNQITVNSSTGDVTARLDYNVKIDADLQVGGFTDEDSGTFSVQTYNNIKAFEVRSDTNPNGQYHGNGTYTNATGVINVNSFINIGSENATPSGYLFANPTTGASGYPTVHLEASGDLALRAGASDTYDHDGNIILYTGSTSGSGTGKVYIGWNNAGGAGANAANQVATIGDIAPNSYIASVDTANFTVTSQELFLNSEIFVDTISSLNSRQDTLSIYGGYSSIVLNQSNGNIELSPDGLVTVNSALTVSNGYNLTVGNNVYVKNGIYAGGSDTETDGYIRVQTAAGSNVFAVSADNATGSATVDVHGVQTFYAAGIAGGNQYGQLTFDSGKNFIINGSYNDVIITSDSGYAYIGNNNSPATRIATLSDVQAAAQGLYVLGSVKTASDVNIDITSPIASVGGVSLSTGDRVLLKSQATPTENGIYIYDAGTGLLTLSTNPVDADIKEGSYTLVEEGNYAAQGWIVTAFSAGASTWTQFSAAGEYTAGNGINISSGVISGVAKENGGLSLDGDGFAALLGTGLQINGGTGAIEIIDYTYITKKMAQTIGDADNTSFDIYHNFNTTDVSVTIYDTDSGEEVFADVVHSNTSKVNVTFAVAPGTNQFRVVVIG